MKIELVMRKAAYETVKMIDHGAKGNMWRAKYNMAKAKAILECMPTAFITWLVVTARDMLADGHPEAMVYIVMAKMAGQDMEAEFETLGLGGIF